MALTTVSTLTALPAAPQKGEAKENFTPKANAFVSAQVNMQQELNVSIGELNTLSGELDALATTVQSNKNATDTNVTSSAASAALAADWANEDVDVVVSGGEYSAKHYSIKSEGFKDSCETIAAAVQDAAGLPSFTQVGDVLKITSMSPETVGWASAGANEYQEFTASGTFNKSLDAQWVYVEAIGGGGGGAAVTSSTGGGGGGGGCFISKLFRSSEIGPSETVTVGAGGSGVQSGGGAQAGNDGGDTLLGALLTAPGGKGGGTSNGGDGGGGMKGTQGGYSSAAGGDGAGGNCIKGGAGGAEGGGGSPNPGGSSLEGGNGGQGGDAGFSFFATDGSAPGGGGGGTEDSDGSTTSGAGGDGRVRIWQW